MLMSNPSDLPPKNKCLHVVALDGYQPEMCSVTIPNLQRYAKRIGADFNLIDKAKFPGYPPNYERLQIHEAGKSYIWNINIDADTILHPKFEDPTKRLDQRSVASLYGIDLRYYFKWNKYFERDGRGRGIADQFVISSWLTHDLWQPLDMAYEEAQQLCLRNPRQVSEYCLSLNLCRFGLKLDAAATDLNRHFSIMCTDRKITNPAEMMIKKLQEWGDTEALDTLPPSLRHHLRPEGSQ